MPGPARTSPTRAQQVIALDHARHFLYPDRIAAVSAAEAWALALELLDPARQVVGLVRAR